ncbi:MAG: hypothetical protein ABSD08_13700 [Xanthobacteraceae bacterium]
MALLLPTVLARAETTAIWRQLTPALHASSRGQAAQQVPDRLVVTRTKNNLNNPTAPPFSKTIVDRSLVEKLYGDIFALPPPPDGIRNCPNDVGIRYHLDFYSGAASLLAADYEPTGCASVRLSDGTVRSDLTGSFGVDLRQALGFSSVRQFLRFQ